jgi:hypothetical protein
LQFVLVKARPQGGQPRQDVVQEMLDTGLKTLTGKPDPQSAWKTIIKPTDIVGIKNNRWGYLQTTPQVQNALKKRILEPGSRKRTSASTTARSVPWSIMIELCCRTRSGNANARTTRS